MKKVLGLLTVAITVFAFAAVVSAAGDYNRTTEPDAHAYKCETKCPLGTIPCPRTTTTTGVQGSTTTTTDDTSPFDYDGKPYLADGFGTFGYSPQFNFDPASEKPRNCKFIFDVCSCGAACTIEPGAKMGIQMYIKTTGVYWAADDIISTETDKYGPESDKPRTGEPTVFFSMYSDNDVDPNRDGNPDDGELCRKSSPLNYMETAPYYYDGVENKRIAGLEGELEGNEVVTGNAVRNFGVIKYYRQIEEGNYVTPDGSTMYGSNSLIPAKPLTDPFQTHAGSLLEGTQTGSIPSQYRYNVLESLEETDYVFTVNDTGAADGNCKVWIDIPTMRIDPTIAKPGEIIKLQVRLLFNRKPSGICPECDPPDVCDVMLDVAVICEPDEGTAAAGSEYCMFFPYVLQGLQDTDGWSTGVAISSRDEMPDDAWVKLELRDRAGNIATYERTSMGSGLVWSFVLDSQIENFTGTLVPGASSLRAISNYSMDGYQFLNVAGTFGAGSNARGCKTGQCCPTVWK